jgi:hypothetical protein
LCLIKLDFLIYYYFLDELTDTNQSNDNDRKSANNL